MWLYICFHLFWLLRFSDLLITVNKGGFNLVSATSVYLINGAQLSISNILYPDCFSIIQYTAGSAQWDSWGWPFLFTSGDNSWSNLLIRASLFLIRQIEIWSLDLFQIFHHLCSSFDIFKVVLPRSPQGPFHVWRNEAKLKKASACACFWERNLYLGVDWSRNRSIHILHETSDALCFYIVSNFPCMLMTRGAVHVTDRGDLIILTQNLRRTGFLLGLQSAPLQWLIAKEARTSMRSSEIIVHKYVMIREGQRAKSYFQLCRGRCSSLPSLHNNSLLSLRSLE